MFFADSNNFSLTDDGCGGDGGVCVQANNCDFLLSNNANTEYFCEILPPPTITSSTNSDPKKMIPHKMKAENCFQNEIKKLIDKKVLSSIECHINILCVCIVYGSLKTGNCK